MSYRRERKAMVCTEYGWARTSQLFISHAGANLNTSSFLLCRRDLDCHLLVILEHAPHLAAKTTKLLCRGACLCCHLLAHNYKFRINKSKNSVTPCQNDDKIVIKDIFPTATHKKNHCSPLLSACRSSVLQHIRMSPNTFVSDYLLSRVNYIFSVGILKLKS